MKLKKGLVFIFILFTFGCTREVLIDLDSNYCGDVYIILVPETLNTGGVVKVDANGVGYASESSFMKNGQYPKVKVVQNDIDITDNCVNISEGYVTTNISQKKYHYIFFHNHCYPECSDENKRLGFIGSNLKKLIDEGYVK